MRRERRYDRRELGGSGWIFLAWLAFAIAVGAACDRRDLDPLDLASLPPPAEPDRPEVWARHYEAMAKLGDGFVVWESFRDGHWRIWLRPLDGSPERQLTPDEPGRDHVAAHVAPDGRHLVYLSLPSPHKGFKQLPPEAEVPLRLARLEDGRIAEQRVLVPNARTYQQSRAAVWVSTRALIYIAADGSTRQIDVRTGEEEVLIPEARGRFGLLLNATRSHATNDIPTFSVYHPGDRSVSPRTRLPGCQPYFTSDGLLGYWEAGVGGPVRTYDLRDYSTRLVIDRDSKWLPKGRGYLYYPMISADRRLLAFAASKNQHGHFTADFEVFVAPLDPESLEVIGTAVRYSFSPGQDRFPDVWIAGSELGVFAGEVPLRVSVEPDADGAAGGAWTVDFGDGAPAGAATEHVYERPGTFHMTARSTGRVLGGQVRVTPAAPPAISRAEVLPEGRELAVVFDEPIEVGAARARLASGIPVTGQRIGERGRDLVLTLARPLAGPDEILVESVADRAGHTIAPARVKVEPVAWPGAGEGLAFVFGTAREPGAARDLDTGHSRSFALVPHGRARYDAHGALLVAGGRFDVEDLPKGFAAAFREGTGMTLEATVWPEVAKTEGPARIVSLAHHGKSQNMSLSQDGTLAVLRIRVTKDGQKDHAVVEFGHLRPDRPHHLLVTYRPGQLVAYQDGRKVFDTDSIQGDFSDWRDGTGLALGADPLDGGRDFAGVVEGVALYTRFFEAEEAVAHANAYADRRARREAVPRFELEARLRASSDLPTPERIVPYREALAVREYEVPADRRSELGADRMRVAHWVVLDATAQSLPEAAPSGTVRLVVEPWDRHPLLEGVYLSDTLEPDPELPLFVDVGS